jgi:Zn-dependent protease
MNFLTVIISLPILIFSAIFHEIAHGLVADRFGDPTARLSGRLTLNPLKHIDLYMSILLPLMLIVSGSPIIFGGAKPVPVDPFNLKEGRKDIALVALAGPLTNILLAIIASISLRMLSFFGGGETIIIGFLYFLFMTIAQFNLLLAIFNLLPIPPLDGSKIFALLLPKKEATAYLALGQIGTFILLFLLLFPVGGFSLEKFIYTLFTFAQNLLGI